MNFEIAKYKFKNGLPLEFEIIPISDLYKTSNLLITEPHRPQFYHIIWIDSGHPVHFADFNSINLSKDSILFVPKNCVNRFDSDKNYDGKVILFTDRFFCKRPDDINFLQSTILYNDFYEISHLRVDPSDSLFINLFSLMTDEYKHPDQLFHYDILRNLLHNFLLYAERTKRKQGFKEIESGPDLEYMILFKDLVEKNYNKFKSVNKYSSDLGISPKRLSKATFKIMEKSPKEIIDERVVLEAKRLLVHGSSTIKEIAYDLGFDEPTNFIKYFRKHEQITPIDFRNNYK